MVGRSNSLAAFAVGSVALGALLVSTVGTKAEAFEHSAKDTGAELAAKDGGKIEELASKDGGKLEELAAKDGGKLEELASKDGGKLEELANKDGGKLEELANKDGGKITYAY